MTTTRNAISKSYSTHSKKKRLPSVTSSLHFLNEKSVHQKRQFQNIAELIPHMVWTATADGRRDYFNRNWMEYTGLSVSESATSDWSGIIHPDDQAGRDEAWNHALKTGQIFDARYRLKRRRDGAYLWHQERAVPLRDSDGRIERWFATVTDVHEQQTLVEELQRQRDLLEKSSTALREMNSELETFAYSISHDLRTPLRGISGFSAALEEDYGHLLGREGQTFLGRIRAATARMGHMVDDLLGLARVGRADLVIHPVDLSAAATVVIERLRTESPARIVEAFIQPGMVVDADPGLVNILLENLLGNAWKFTKNVERSRIEMGRTESGEFFVKDNGAGFDLRFAARLYTPFQRFHSPEEFPGTGLGLAIVQRVVRRHGGEIRAETAPGEGATLFFRLSSGLP
ncbi:MAG TPA: PAS domain-containing protein [Thermoanaerobaculia bacterium]|nr:PAS domain-containing protein [Thermoanaerobaculia bacterium]